MTAAPEPEIRADAEFRHHRVDRGGLGRVVTADLGTHAHRALAQLGGIGGGTCHDSDPYTESSLHSNRGGSLRRPGQRSNWNAGTPPPAAPPTTHNTSAAASKPSPAPAPPPPGSPSSTSSTAASPWRPNACSPTPTIRWRPSPAASASTNPPTSESSSPATPVSLPALSVRRIGVSSEGGVAHSRPGVPAANSVGAACRRFTMVSRPSTLLPQDHGTKVEGAAGVHP